MPAPTSNASPSLLLQRLMPALFGTTQGGSAAGAACRTAQRRPCPPALTGGESTNQGAKVDWLSLTWLPEPDEHVPMTVHALLNSLIYGGVMGEETNGMLGYANGARFYVAIDGTAVSVARVDFGGTNKGGRARLDISGTGCSRLLRWDRFTNWIAEWNEVTLTRVDLAADMLNGEYGVENAIEWYQNGEFNAGGRNPRHSLVGDWLAPKHGRTFEVGRRENGKMLRAYEKGRQLGDSQSLWTRFEVELRNNDRDLPIDILTRCDAYFTGAYKCLERLIDAAAERIKCHQKEGEISLEHLVTYAKSAYGQLFHVLRANLSASEVIEQVSRIGVPKRLEKSYLGGFNGAALH